MKPKINTKFYILLIILVTITVLYISLKDNFYEIIIQIFNANIKWLLVGIFLVSAYWFLKANVLYETTKKLHSNFTYKQAFKMTLVTQLANAITPFSSGGQAYQVYALKKSGVKIADGTNIIIQNFIVYQIALVTLGLIAVFANQTLHLYKEVGLLKYLVTFGFICNTLVIIILFIVAFAKKLNNFLIQKGITLLEKLHLIKNVDKVRKNWKDYINNFHIGAKHLMQDKWHFIRQILYNILALSCLYLVPLVILYSMNDFKSMDAFLTIVTSAYVMLIGSFVPIPGGSGGLEYGFIAFYSNFITGSVLTSVMLIWRFITYYFGIMIGAMALNTKEKR